MSRIADAAFGDEPVGYPRSPGFRDPTTSREAAQAEVETEGMHGFSRTAAQQRLEQLRQAGEGAP